MNISSINKNVGKIFEYTANRNWCKKGLEKGFNEPAKYAATMLVTSIVSKDLVGCFVYTTQSYNNKKIPEDKRKFVAATDLMNGIIMVFGQYFVGGQVDSKLTPSLFGKYFSGIVKCPGQKPIPISKTDAPLHNNNIYKYTEEVLKEKGLNSKDVNLNEIAKKAVEKWGSKGSKYKAIETGFGIIVVALATNALTKRTIAPLFSTPLASWFKGKYMEKGNKKPENKPEAASAKPAGDTFAPWANTASNGLDKTAFNKFTK